MKNIRQLLANEYKIYSNRYAINIQKIKDNNLMQEYMDFASSRRLSERQAVAMFVRMKKI